MDNVLKLVLDSKHPFSLLNTKLKHLNKNRETSFCWCLFITMVYAFHKVGYIVVIASYLFWRSHSVSVVTSLYYVINYGYTSTMPLLYAAKNTVILWMTILSNSAFSLRKILMYILPCRLQKFMRLYYINAFLPCNIALMTFVIIITPQTRDVSVLTWDLNSDLDAKTSDILVTWKPMTWSHLWWQPDYQSNIWLLLSCECYCMSFVVQLFFKSGLKHFSITYSKTHRIYKT